MNESCGAHAWTCRLGLEVVGLLRCCVLCTVVPRRHRMHRTDTVNSCEPAMQHASQGLGFAWALPLPALPVGIAPILTIEPVLHHTCVSFCCMLTHDPVGHLWGRNR